MIAILSADQSDFYILQADNDVIRPQILQRAFCSQHCHQTCFKFEPNMGNNKFVITVHYANLLFKVQLTCHILSSSVPPCCF